MFCSLLWLCLNECKWNRINAQHWITWDEHDKSNEQNMILIPAWLP